MKKIILAFLSVVILGSGAMAQGKAKMEKANKKTDAPQAQNAPVQNAPNEQAKLKKDGTPDKRYKANKAQDAQQPSGPTKKDGTPDMRHKANKEAAGKK